MKEFNNRLVEGYMTASGWGWEQWHTYVTQFHIEFSASESELLHSYSEQRENKNKIKAGKIKAL